MDSGQLHERVRAYIGEHMPSVGDDRVVLAASGGADSAAMVALMFGAGLIDASRAVVAHFDHRLRGAEASARDRTMVRALCERYGVELTVGEWAEPRSGEAAARDARYAFLRDVARRHEALLAVTGHTLDDQIETVLMRSLRGAGLHGLSGMSALARWPDGSTSPQIARPLLCLSRAETRGYCADRGIAYVDDASNEDEAFLRNRIRRHALPQLDGEERARIVALADAARAAAAVFDAAVTPIVQAGGDVARMSRAGLAALADELRPHAWRRATVELTGDARDFERRHYALLSRVHAAATGSTFELPRGLRVTVDHDAVLLSRGALALPAVPEGLELALPYTGTVGAWRVDVRRADGRTDVRLPEQAVLRGRRPGDRIQPAGMRGHKKLQDYYVDRRVARRERDAAPVIAAGREVLWTPFGRADLAAVAGEAFGIEAARVAG